MNTRRSPVLRTRPLRPKSNSARQLNRKAIYQRVSIAWQNLSRQEQSTWLAAARTFPIVNALGVASQLSGWQYFHKVQLQALTVGSTFILEPQMTFLDFTANEPTVSFNQGGPYNIAFSAAPDIRDRWLIFRGARTFSTALPIRSTGVKQITAQFFTPLDPPFTDIFAPWNSIIGEMQAGETFALTWSTLKIENNMTLSRPLLIPGVITA